MYDSRFIANLLPSVSAKGFQKSINQYLTEL